MLDHLVIGADRYFSFADHRLMDAALLARLHNARMKGLCFTVNEPEDAARLLALGIDGLITDAVDRFTPA